MIAPNYKEQYLKTKVETASPGDLTLLLYEELYRKLNMAKMFFNQNDHEAMLDKIHGARSIFYELIVTLNFDYEISNQLKELYEYYLRRINEFTVRKQEEILIEVIDFARDYAETWKKALHIVKSSRG
ncbi:flagellar export chaperone FliS [Paenibacillus sp. RC84]|uniref:flagellar export chaperone FliS n=1 Tax=Paenibacillus sp. RC84 TaxID=3156252 RepID=UPI0035154584